jgi:PAS domain S-box-containing protein
MAGERLMIVEDERIVAEDLRDMLKRLNYEVVGMASTGEEAIQKAEELQPDLVLMDIRLAGEMDGTQAAELIWAQQGIPVTYLTAYADESTLERAKATLPFGYILKPFEERDLRTTIEIALYKHQMESTFNKMEGFHAAALESLSDGVIATNAQGSITFMNPAAEQLTGWTLRQAYGQKFNETIRVSSASGSQAALRETTERPAGLLKTKDGQEVRIEYGVNPMKNDQGQVTGHIVILHPASPQQARSVV